MSKGPHQIPVSEAAALTLNWRRNRPPESIDAGRFEKVAFDNIFAQAGCVGIRIYMARHLDSDPVHAKDPSKWTFVLVGTDDKGNDITSTTAALAVDDGDTEQNPFRCPPVCSSPGPLNTPP